VGSGLDALYLGAREGALAGWFGLDKIEREVKGGPMADEREPNPEPDAAQAAAHLASAHQVLKTLQDKIGEHPELATAINKLEMALSILAVQTGGLL
jgi:hypothetical protein